MEVKPGYKQTEVGVIPKDWNVTPLVSFTTEIGDGIHSTPRYVKSSEFYFVNGNNLVNDSITVTEETMCVSEAEYKALRKNLTNRTLLLSINGTIGNLALYNGEKVVLGKSAAYINVSEKVSREFISFCLKSRSTALFFENELTGTTIRNLSLQSLRNTPVPLPSTRQEQRAIAAALGEVDALINALDQIIAKKRDIKQAAMQQLLTGKQRLPRFDGEWSVKRFGDIAQPRKERIDPRRKGVQEFCIELEHIEQETGHLTGYMATGDGSSLKSVFQKGDVLFGKLRAYLRKYWLANREGVCSTEIWVLVANRSLLVPEFLFQLVKLDRFVEAASIAYGTHMPRSDWNVVKNYEVHLPLLDEQTAIATVLSDMDAELAALEQRRDKTRALKQGMMQELLCGKTRLV